MKSLPKHLLYPSDIFIAKTPCIVTTVLGSCVSVCLYDPAMEHGSINHYILPQWNGHDLSTMKYGNMSIIRILEGLLKLGSKYENVVARVFGGAKVLSGVSTDFHIGERNSEIAFEILNEFRIPVLYSNVGGNRGRRISFNTQTGEVECDFIPRREKIREGRAEENKIKTERW